MTPTQIKAALEQLGAKPNKSLGQHFLIDKAVLEAIIAAADIKLGDRVLEVGPGLGVLTRALLERGAEVVAIERDRKFVLSPNLSPARQGKGELQVIFGDAAKLDWDAIVGDKPWKFISNLPYSITSLALRKALYAKNPPTMVVVLVQREVAERAIMNAKRITQNARLTGKTSLLSLMVGLAVGSVSDVGTPSEGVPTERRPNIQIIRRVPAGAFYPPPKVESAILRIVPRRTSYVPGIGNEEIMQIAKKGFAHPRKLLQRNLGIEDGKWQELSKQMGFDVKTRAEDLTVGEWAELAKILETGN